VLVTSMKIASLSVLTSSVVTDLLMNLAMSRVFEMINSLQLIAFLQNYNVYMPANADYFLNFVTEMAEFDVLPKELIFGSFVSELQA
jgi:hypothetical protein